MAAESMSSRETGSTLVKRGLAEMLKGGVIMDVVERLSRLAGRRGRRRSVRSWRSSESPPIYAGTAVSRG